MPPSLAGAGFLIATSNGLNDRFGRPLGTDFSNVYAAGTYVLDGEPAAPFDPAKQFAREQEIFGPATQFYGWHYPPYFLGLAAALATMPYWLSLLVWQGVTLILYLLAIRAIVFSPPSPKRREGKNDVASPRRSPSPRCSSISARLITASSPPRLIGTALCQLDRRPILAGVLIGLLAYKPQFGVLIPLVLVASGRWRAFAAAAVTVALHDARGHARLRHRCVDRVPRLLARFTRTVVLEQGGTGWYKIQSVFSWVRMWGGGIALAYAAQVAVTLALAAALVWLWRSRAAYPLKAAALLIGSLLATPYSLDYDLMLLAPAIAYLCIDGFARGFAAYEKTSLAALWIVPLIARTRSASNTYSASSSNDVAGVRIIAAPRHK